MMKELLKKAQNLQTELSEYRRWLHQNAEVGFSLEKTQSFVKEKLTEMGYTPKECGRAGILAVLGKENAKQAVLLRADMDALPLRERTGLSFACKSGNMHACGHDMHTAMLLGAARLLKEYARRLPYAVKLLFQPAEEILQGARDCIESGALENPSVIAALTVHVMTGVPLPIGTLVIPAAGVGAPAADYFTVEISGKSCHGSAPQNGVDALNVAAHIFIALQEISAREIPVSSLAVLTVGKLYGGSAGNAIADCAVLEGTLRALDEETRAFIKNRLKELVCGIAKSFRAKAKVRFSGGCPTLVNHEEICARLKKCAGQVFDERQIIYADELSSGVRNRSGGSEDFAYISQKTPSAMFALSAGGKEKGESYPLHHPKVDFDERVLPLGAALFAAFALDFSNE